MTTSVRFDPDGVKATVPDSPDPFTAGNAIVTVSPCAATIATLKRGKTNAKTSENHRIFSLPFGHFGDEDSDHIDPTITTSSPFCSQPGIKPLPALPR